MSFGFVTLRDCIKSKWCKTFQKSKNEPKQFWFDNKFCKSNLIHDYQKPEYVTVCLSFKSALNLLFGFFDIAILTLLFGLFRSPNEIAL